MAHLNSTVLPVSTILPDNNFVQNISTFDYVTEAVATILNVYYTPFLVILGCVGNLLSILGFHHCCLRNQSTSVYLRVLAISDSVFLVQLLPPWLNAIQLTSLFHRPGFCQVFVYISYVTCFLSAWLVVAFTVERFVAVLYPLRRNSMCTVKRAKHIVALIVLVAIVLNLPVLKFASPSTNDCNIDFEYLEHAARFNMLDTALSFTVPLAIIIVLNVWITVGVLRLERARRALVLVEEQAPFGLERLAQPTAPRTQNRITRMLLIVSTVYVVLNVPAYTMRILAYAYDMGNGDYSGRWAALQQLALMFFNTNFGINFILYCLSGQNFRRALCQSIPCLRRYAPEDIVYMSNCRNYRTSSVTSSTASTATVASTAFDPLTVHSAGPNYVRRHGSEPVVTRWRFDNSRIRRIMHEGTVDDSEPVMVINPGAPEQRVVPFVLFPYRNMLVPRPRTDPETNERADQYS